jgi:hypothetical protein
VERPAAVSQPRLKCSASPVEQPISLMGHSPNNLSFEAQIWHRPNVGIQPRL